MHTGHWRGNIGGKILLGRPRRKWNDNIKMVLQKVGWGAWTGLIGFRIGTGGGSFKSAYELSGSIKCGEILDGLTAGQLLKKESAS